MQRRTGCRAAPPGMTRSPSRRRLS